MVSAMAEADRPILTDGVVRLRPFQEGDPVLQVALHWYQDPEVMYYADGPDATPFDTDRLRRMYRYLNTHAELYVIEVYDGSDWQPIGDAALAPNTTPIVIGESAWRSRGIGSRVLGLLIERARALGYEALYAKEIWTYNVRSQRLFERLGFHRIAEGIDQQGRPWYRYRLDLS